MIRTCNAVLSFTCGQCCSGALNAPLVGGDEMNHPAQETRTMKLNKTFLTMMFGSALAVAPAFAQEESNHTQEVTVQGVGSFVKSTVSNGVQQSATNTGGVLASYRFFFNAHNG